MKKLFFTMIAAVTGAAVFAQDTIFDSLQIVAPGAAIKEVSNQFSFTEGPATDKKGNIYFTDQPNDKIWKYDTEGTLTLFMEKAGRSNGLYIDKKGNIVACADLQNELWRISPDKQITVLLSAAKGSRYNGPNDLWLDKKGGIYFTDPFYPRPYWDRKEPEIEGQKVYYLAAGAKQALPVNDELKKPNGIVGSPDGKYLYVADIGDNKTYRFLIAGDGSLSDKTLFAELGSDGITLDNKGNLYLTGKGVTVFSPEGKRIAHIPISSGWTANVCFGGKKKNILFITASKSVFVLPMNVKGVE